MENEKQQEIMYKLSLFEQQIQQLQQQIQAVEQGINELTNLETGLNDLKGSKDKEILAPVGRGIYAKAKLLSEELKVDVGNQNFVKKSIPETQELILTQINKLEKIKEEIESKIEETGEELQKTILEAQK